MTSTKQLDLRPLAAHREAATSVRKLLTSVGQVLGNELLAVWFDGSVALGDFDPRRSDVDLLVLIAKMPSDRAVTALRATHAHSAAATPGWVGEIEVIYVAPEALRPAAASSGVPHLYVERRTGGVLRAAPLDPGWLVHLRVLREDGLSVSGPAPADLVEAVSDDELKRFAVWGAEHWLTPYREDPATLDHIGERVFCVLTMCRLGYTMRTGQVVPKMTAARWALDVVPRSLAPVIEGAIAWRKDDLSSETTTVEGVLSLIGWTQLMHRSQHSS